MKPVNYGIIPKKKYVICFLVIDILIKQTRIEKVREVVDMLNNAVNCLAAANTNNGKRPTSRFVASHSN